MHRALVGICWIIFTAFTGCCIFGEEQCFEINSGVDYSPGSHDIASFDNIELADCCKRCKNNPQCKTFVWSTSSRMCWFKDVTGPVVPNGDRISGFANPKKTYTQEQQQCYGVNSGVDYSPGSNDVATINDIELGDCCAECKIHSQCKTFVWSKTSRTCWFKDATTPAVPNPDRISGFSDPKMTLTGGQSSSVTSGMDYSPGSEYDIAALQTDLAGCCSTCSNITSCKSYVWSKSSGWCWLKNTDFPRIPNDDRVSGLPARTKGNNFDESETCSVYRTEGVKINCDDPESGIRIDCDVRSHVPVGTRANFTCEKHYLPSSNRNFLIQQCNVDGHWTPSVSFGCIPDCGKAEKALNLLVVNGTITSRELWPWHIAMFIEVDGQFSYYCGGSIIQRSSILTAAHCLLDEHGEFLPETKIKVVLAPVSSNYMQNVKDSQAQVFDIIKYYYPDKFNTRNFQSDIAIIVLHKSIVFNDYIRPVCFPSKTDEHRSIQSFQLSSNSLGQVIGFGIDETLGVSTSLKFANLPVKSTKECFEVLQDQPHESTYCAGYTNGTSVCNGDSGGGMVFSSGTGVSPKYFIQGIVSHGPKLMDSPLCNAHSYAIFTRVGFFSDWIEEQIRLIE